MTEMTLEQQLGQMLLVGFEGLTSPDYILDWIATGRIGGVILFGRNVESPEQVARLTQTLHEAARKAGRPPKSFCYSAMSRLRPWASLLRFLLPH